MLIRVALDSPLAQFFDYHCPHDIPKGTLVWVPFGRGNKAKLAVVVESNVTSTFAPEKLKSILQTIDLATILSPLWLELCLFASSYYHHPLGEVVIGSLPQHLRKGNTAALSKVQKKILEPKELSLESHIISLNNEQQNAFEAIKAAQGFTTFLLHGVTGSGKTEVYLHACSHILKNDSKAQVLFLVPEINLIEPFLKRIEASFKNLSITTLHSQLSEGKRLHNWLLAHSGSAQIILGTRLAVMASLPHLKLIIVDEEHDPSYKQQDGWHYSARDLAVWRAKQLNIPAVLGSATPSIESWHAQDSKRYHLLSLTKRASSSHMPSITLVDVRNQKLTAGLSVPLLESIKQRLADNQQSLLFINRRGYAPVLSCFNCSWVSECPHCVAMQVLHTADNKMHCHLCASQSEIPKACPVCGNKDITPLGRGTQRISEDLANIFTAKPDNSAVNILRIDADSTRKKGSAQESFAQVHNGNVDILVGTQMVSKGHDFKNLTLVGILNADSALFQSDFRAAERLFAQLLQVAGRAGRHTENAQVLIQTRHPEHPFYENLIRQDYVTFANETLEERRQAQLPPFNSFALVRAQAKKMQQVLDFLKEVKTLLPPTVIGHDPVPMTIARIADIDRAQLLIEAPKRPILQHALRAWLPEVYRVKTSVRWQIEVDPLEI